MELDKVGIGSFAALGLGTILMVCVPIGIAVWWLVRRKGGRYYA